MGRQADDDDDGDDDGRRYAKYFMAKLLLATIVDVGTNSVIENERVGTRDDVLLSEIVSRVDVFALIASGWECCLQ